MKLAFRDIESFVKNPSSVARIILIYGPDNGLMKERSRSISQTLVTDINDPFNVALLDPSILSDDPARLSDEANAMSMMGGHRLIRVESASDKLTPLIKTYLEHPNDNATIILEAGELSPRSSLRKLCEKDKAAVALPCYIEDERDLARFIREAIQNANQTIDQDALHWLAINISGDRAKVRMEIDKLITYKGDEAGNITLNDVRAACGEAGAQGLDDLVYSVAGRKPIEAFRAYHLLSEEGVNFVVILRALQNHFRKLHLTKIRIENGENPARALKMLTPPIFFKQEAAFKAQLNSWSLPVLNTILGRLNALEAECKKTGAPTHTLCYQAILGLSKKI